MNKRQRNQLRTRVWDTLAERGRTEEARAAWGSAWSSRRQGVQVKDVERARFAMLKALDDGQTIADAQKVAERELSTTQGE